MDEVFKYIQNQRDLYGSGIKHLDVSAEELFQNSHSSLTRLSSELSNHSSSIMNLIQKSSSDADNICNGLKVSLNNLGSRIDAFIKQEQENHVRTYQTTKSISHGILNFFKTLRLYISKLRLMEEDSRTITEQKMSAFAKKFEEFALGEERLLLQQMAEILASSTSRKKKIIEAAVDDILDISCKKTERLNQEITDVQTLASDAEEKWSDYIDRTRGNYVGDSVVVEVGKSILEEGLQCCIAESTEIAEQRRVAEESLLDMFKRKIDSVDSLIKNATEDNEKFEARFSSVASSVLEETEDAGKSTLLSLEYPLRLEHEASEKIDSLGARCLEDMKGMNTIHSEKVVEISRIAKRSLLDDYLVDEAAALTPRKRNFDLESKEYFENLIDVPFGDSLKSSQAHVVETQD